jgi:TetR/AcrR family transcriptional regulator
VLVSTPQSIPTKQILLAVAVAEFAAKGFAGARVDQIARRASVNKQMIYHYFGDKRGLYEAALEEMVDSARDQREQFLGKDLGEVFQVMRENARGGNAGQWLRMLMREGIDNPSQVVLEDRRRESLVNHVAAIEKARKKTPQAAYIDADLTYLIMIFLHVGPQLLPQIVELATGQDATSEEFLQRYEAAVRRLLTGDDSGVPPAHLGVAQQEAG